MSDNGDEFATPTDDVSSAGGRPRATRRSVMKGLAGAAVAGAAFSGVASAHHTDGVPQRLVDKFDNVVNVAYAGADRDGNESINDVLDEHRDDHTLLYFPSGTYYMDRLFRFTTFEHFGIYGNDATIVPADYHDITDGQHKLFRLGTHYDPGQKLHVENITVDMTAPDTGVRAFEAAVSEDLLVRDVTVEGRHDSGMWGPGRFVLRDPDATGLVERFKAKGGADFSAETPSAGTLWRGPTGILCNSLNVGTMTFRDCELGGFPDNGLYTSGSKGPIRVEGGVYENSNGNNVRVGSPDNVISGATIRVNETSSHANAHRGIRLEGAGETLIEDTTIDIDVPVSGSTPVVIMADCEGRTTIQDSRIEQRSDVFNNGIDASVDCGDVKIARTDIVQDTPGGSAIVMGGDGDADEWAELIYVNILGSPGDKWNRAAIYNERSNVEFRAVTVDQTGGPKRRALVNYGDDCIMYKCDFNVNNYPVIDKGSGTWASYNTFEANDGSAGYFLTDESSDVYLKQNTIHNGIRDDGSANLELLGNEY